MKKQISFWLGAVLLWAALDCSQAGVIPTYFEVGGNLELRPTVSENITNILWKYNGNLLAEWVKGEVDLTYYDKYEGRTTLDPVSGLLEVKNMNKADEGSYTVEINNKVHGQSYNVKSITKVPKPSVVVRTLTCSPDSESCLLSCDGQEPESLKEAEPIEYNWKMEEKEWKKMEQSITITKTETADVKTISCQMKNPVSQKDSEPVKNPMYKEPETDGLGPGPGTIVGIIIPVLLVLVGVGGVFWWQKKKRGGSTDIDLSEKGQQHVPGPTSPEAPPNNTPDAPPNNTPETQMLNTAGAQPNNTPEAPPNNSPEAPPNNSPEAPPNNSPEAPPNNSSETEPLNPADPATDPPATQ